MSSHCYEYIIKSYKYMYNAYAYTCVQIFEILENAKHAKWPCKLLACNRTFVISACMLVILFFCV